MHRDEQHKLGGEWLVSTILLLTSIFDHMPLKVFKYLYYFLVILITCIPFTCLSQSINSAVSVLPRHPLIEIDSLQQYLNFDLVYTNTLSSDIEIIGCQVSVFGPDHRLVLRKSLNNNGRSPSISLIGKTTISAGETICVFNPFFQFSRDIDIQDMQFEFFVNEIKKEKHAKRLPFDYDTVFKIAVQPKIYQLHTNLQLPLKGKLIIWDGHDFFSHHRRFPIGTTSALAEGIKANSNRYANDINMVDEEGNMYKGSPFKKENWYAYGQKIFAPGKGIVVAVENNIPDNEFEGNKVVLPKLPAGVDSLGMGNYVIINHGNHEYSIMLHMKSGSVSVKKGDHVTQGQWIGNIGFSGDAINPHLHYTVTSGINEGKDEGIPGYFYNFYKYQNGKWILYSRGKIESGELIRRGK